MTKLEYAYDKLYLLRWVTDVVFDSKNFQYIRTLRSVYIEMLDEHKEHDCKASADSGCEVCDLLMVIRESIDAIEQEMEKYKD